MYMKGVKVMKTYVAPKLVAKTAAQDSAGHSNFRMRM